MVSYPTEEDLLRMSLSADVSEHADSTFTKEKDLGNAAFRAGKYHDAIQHYTAAEAANPLSPIPPANRAMAHLKLQNFHAVKADASVALELQSAAPRQHAHDALRVKILLRRASANRELMLLALAADDFAQVLQIDPSHAVAAAQLADLDDKHAVRPSLQSTPSVPSNHIQVVAESRNVNGGARAGANGSVARKGASSIARVQDELSVVQLPEDVMRGLVSKWSLSPPANAMDFEQAWRSLKANPSEQAHYLLNVVGHDRIKGGVLGETLTPQLLEEFIDVLGFAAGEKKDIGGVVADMLMALTCVARFTLLLMFLSAEKKRQVTGLIEGLGGRSVDGGLIARLRERYV